MFRVALCQASTSGKSDITEYKEESKKKIAGMVAEAAGNGANVVCLPEMWNCPYNTKEFAKYQETAKGETWQFLQKLAKGNQLYLIGGSIPELEEGHIYNTCFVFDPQGNQIGRHRKVHLFDIAVEGGHQFRESDVLTAGDCATVFDTEYGRMGVIICFDIRFSDFVRKEAIEGGAQMIFMPAAFNMTTGPAHWDLTLRARALDNQIFFAACAPARDNLASYVSYGNSAIVGPWGDFKAHADFNETILYADIDFGEIERIRSQIPIVRARRPELY